MEKFEYKAHLHLNVWQEVSLTVKAPSKEKADAIISQLAATHPLSLDNGNDCITITNTEYLTETESLINGTTNSSVEVYDSDCECCTSHYALYTNVKNN